MSKKLLKISSLFISFVILIMSFSVVSNAAKSTSQLNSDIAKLEQQSKDYEAKIKEYSNQIDKQKELKSAIEQKIALTQQEINLCNSEIAKINSKIATNKAEIDKKNQEIEADKLAFKKRLRAIYMSNQGSDVQILLGAENFSDFLQLSQMTASVSAHDKIMIEKIVAAVSVLEEKQKENEKLLENQAEIKKTIDAKQADLKAQNNQIQSVINSIASDKSDAQQDNADTEKQIAAMKNELNAILAAANNSVASSNVKYDGGQFLWPCPSIGKITSGFGPRWGTMHNGIDISNGSFGAPIVAIADGQVTTSSNSCPHNYGKNCNCCGNGYGNYVVINHGTNNGKSYVAYYAHMSNTAVSAGTYVKKGQVIGYVGSTGWSTGPHLHFGLIVNGSWVNPMNYYSKVG